MFRVVLSGVSAFSSSHGAHLGCRFVTTGLSHIREIGRGKMTTKKSNEDKVFS